MKPYHAPSREIWALFMLLSITGQAVKSENTGRNEIMRLEKVKILYFLVRKHSCPTSLERQTS
jgi:hypothetical protein